MIENLAEFHDGRRDAVSEKDRGRLPSVASRALRRGGFLWVSLAKPGEVELGELATTFGLHELAVADAISGRQQPKIQAYDEHLFVVLWALSAATDVDAHEIAIDPVMLFVRDGLLITVTHPRHDGDRLRFGDVLEQTFAKLDHGVLGGLYAVMSSIVAGYTEVAGRLETELETLERQVFDDGVQENARQIYRMRQRIGRIQRAVSGIAAALEASKDHLRDLSVGHEKVEPYFRDLMDDLAGTNQLVVDQDRALDGVLASHENNVSLRQNDDMRKISAFAALLSVPAVLAGVYGMNFKNLPGVSWVFGWEVLVGAILVIDLAIYLAFKHRHWL